MKVARSPFVTSLNPFRMSQTARIGLPFPLVGR